jgi:diguanylate cyclase
MANDLSLFRGEPGVERAKEIIERMRARSIPPTPANYEVWTAHVAGILPELSSQIETQIASGAPFNDELNTDLFERFFANTRLSVQMLETSKLIAEDLNGSASSLRDSGAQANAYANILQASIGALDGGAQAVLTHLKTATHGMIEHNLKLAEQLEASSRQIEMLKAALASIKVEGLTDGLTGLANRRMFDETLQRRLREAKDANSELCVLLIDADHFAQLNTNWGQALGDQVLCYIGAVLQAHVQGDVLAARLSADDFAVIMPRTNVNLAEGFAERVARAVKSKQILVKSMGERLAPVTISAGVACFRGDEGDNVLARARTCLLAAKASGRDRVISDLQLRRQSAA